MRLYLIRHGETEGNRQCYIGRQDLPLNEEGRRQAAALASALSEEEISAIYASPLQRARDTAAPLALQHTLNVEVRPALLEIDYGDLQGLVKGAHAFSLRREYLHTPMPGGESVADVWRRVEPFAAELKSELVRGNAPAVVGHYWSNRVLLDVLAGTALEEVTRRHEYKPGNGSALAIDFEESGGELRIAGMTWRVES